MMSRFIHAERPTVESIPTLEGAGLLTTLHYYNVVDDLVLAYHGGKTAVQKINTSIPCWQKDGVKYPDSDVPVVCALESPLVPTFYALAPRGFRSYFGTEEGGLRLLLKRDAAEEFYRAQGCVAVLQCGEGWTVFEGGAPTGWPDGSPIRLPEMRSIHDQTPLFNVKVSVDNFWQLLQDEPAAAFEIVS